MSFVRTLWVAVTALSRTKTRSFLTMLSVIIGVGAVIAMVSIGEGAKARVAATFESMGTNTLVVSSGSSQRGGVRGGAGSQPTMTWADLTAIRALPEVAEASPQLRTGAQVVSDEANWQTSVNGVSPEWFSIRKWRAVSGEVLSASDVAGSRKVAVLGKTVATNLFGEGVDPVGMKLRIDRVPFEVVGVLAGRGTNAMGSDDDDVVLIPSSTYASKIAGGLAKYLGGQILVTSASSDRTLETKLAIEELLRRTHKIRAGKNDDFNVRDLSAVAAARTESTNTITSLLAGVALVSLLVGGIGIKNIMLVSVTERTREIGLRMAVGAKPRNVLLQFLIEAMLLSTAGGILGIAAGIGAAEYMAGRFDFPTLIRLDIVAIAVAVSAAIGVTFGLYPARKASRLDPITALRYE